MKALYIFGDGDRVRERIESLLFDHKTEELKAFSSSLGEAVNVLAELLKMSMQAEILMAGGDDVLTRISADKYSRSKLAELVEVYKVKTGVTISFGVGPTLESAYLNLRRAKASGIQKIVETEVTQ